MLTIAAGAAVGLVAARGDRRRATTWIGVRAVFGGAVEPVAAPTVAA